MPPNVHTFTHHPALIHDIGCYCWGAMLLKLGGSRSLLSAVGDRLSLCLITGTLPSTRSCIAIVLEKQIVRRTSRLIRVRKLMCLLSIFCVWALPIVCCSGSSERS